MSKRQKKSPSDHRVVNETILSIILAAMGGAPTYAKILLAVLGVIAIIGVPVSVAFITAGEAPLAFSLMAIVLLLVAAILFITYKLFRSTPVPKSVKPDRKNVEVLWSRIMLRQPINQSDAKRVAQHLENMRKSAFTWLSQTIPGVGISDLRANIFVPDYLSAVRDGVFDLYMQPEWKCNMSGHPDENLKLRPGEGVAGACYTNQDAEHTEVGFAPNGALNFPGKFKFTKAQQGAVHSELRWIIAFPLKTRRNGQDWDTIGVAGLHGLRIALTDDQREHLKAHLFADVLKIAANLGKLRRINLGLISEEI